MTGKYIDFKGKLKVGDRVRHCLYQWNAEATVTEIDEEWLRTTEGCFLWTWDTGTLELLTPSPRVVTLENLEPGDEVRQDKIKMTVDDVGGFKKLIVLLDPSGNHNVWTAEDLKKWGWQPVQPASPPAPAEMTQAQIEKVLDKPLASFKSWGDVSEAMGAPVKLVPAEKEEEWWESDSERFGDPSTWDIREIVTEAKRRGAKEAWKECRFFVARMKLWSKGNVEGTRQDILAIFDAKIESLEQPAGAGEN